MLLKPNKKLAQRILKEVGFDDRIEGYRLRKRTGALPTTMYSFQELAGFLSDTCPRIDFIRLMNWIDNVMEDRELADKIDAVIRTDHSDREKMSKIGELVVFRLVQCKKAA